MGLDFITLPSHTSHALQPLDVTCFKPFKTTFKTYNMYKHWFRKGKALKRKIWHNWCPWF